MASFSRRSGITAFDRSYGELFLKLSYGGMQISCA